MAFNLITLSFFFLPLLIVSGLSHPSLLALSFPFSKKQQFTEEELQAYEKEVAEMEKKQEEKLRKMEAKHAKAADTAVSPFRNFDGQWRMQRFSFPIVTIYVD